jgi:hypothetical protein
MARHRRGEARALPHALVRLIHAAEDSGNRDSASALRELGQLALTTIPNLGVFVAHENDIEVAVERIAKAHLGLGEARREFREATRVIESFKQRDPIESAHHQIEIVNDEAWFFAGLAFGVTLLEYSRCDGGSLRSEPRLRLGSGIPPSDFRRSKRKRGR